MTKVVDFGILIPVKLSVFISFLKRYIDLMTWVISPSTLDFFY